MLVIIGIGRAEVIAGVAIVLAVEQAVLVANVVGGSRSGGIDGAGVGRAIVAIIVAIDTGHGRLIAGLVASLKFVALVAVFPLIGFGIGGAMVFGIIAAVLVAIVVGLGVFVVVGGSGGRGEQARRWSKDNRDGKQNQQA